ncbi:type II toxin-antitoxin system death-on-curing family toxin [Demequina pelophila]|uniref:type II toxin-antitoxin system death-on-curing family toxin n=1 Tax=Demequina pelophila TaxID=1638984 RepID=UPI0007817BC1|nr:type II toxin-antitoxin system death-on-curing family toxin [Demequina pelophila]
MTEFLSLEDLLGLTADLGVGPVRDLGLLSAAVERPATTLYGQEAYRTLDDKAAALLESIVINHALVDGNKRLGWLAAAVFYDLNGVDIDTDEDNSYDLVIAVATGNLRMPELAAALGLLRTA